jgi:hypothetical protein
VDGSCKDDNESFVIIRCFLNDCTTGSFPRNGKLTDEGKDMVCGARACGPERPVSCTHAAVADEQTNASS